MICYGVGVFERVLLRFFSSANSDVILITNLLTALIINLYFIRTPSVHSEVVFWAVLEVEYKYTCIKHCLIIKPESCM